MRKNIIINLAEQIKLYLIEIKEEEDSCNEGALTCEKYNIIMELLNQIITETLLIQNFWEEE